MIHALAQFFMQMFGLACSKLHRLVKTRFCPFSRNINSWYQVNGRDKGANECNRLLAGHFAQPCEIVVTFLF